MAPSIAGGGWAIAAAAAAARGGLRKFASAQNRLSLLRQEALDDAVKLIVSRCTEVESGARNVDHILTRTLLPEISKEFLAKMANGEGINKVHVSVGSQGGFQYKIV